MSRRHTLYAVAAMACCNAVGWVLGLGVGRMLVWWEGRHGC